MVCFATNVMNCSSTIDFSFHRFLSAGKERFSSNSNQGDRKGRPYHTRPQEVFRYAQRQRYPHADTVPTTHATLATRVSLGRGAGQQYRDALRASFTSSTGTTILFTDPLKGAALPVHFDGYAKVIHDRHIQQVSLATGGSAALSYEVEV